MFDTPEYVRFYMSISSVPTLSSLQQILDAQLASAKHFYSGMEVDKWTLHAKVASVVA